MKKDLEKKLLAMEAKQERGIRKIQIMMLAFMVNTMRQKDKDNKVLKGLYTVVLMLWIIVCAEDVGAIIGETRA